MKQPQRYGTSGMHREDGVFCLYSDMERVVGERERLRAALTDDDIRRALVAWFDPLHPDQNDFVTRMRKAIDAACAKERA